MNTSSQKQAILKWLTEGNAITPLEALQLFGCFRLSGRIFDLRRDGYSIITDSVITYSGKRIAKYRMV
jgi:hypothetical protein